LENPATSDNCAVKSLTNDAPAVFPIGTTPVIWVVYDIHGNWNTCTQLVTVNKPLHPIKAVPGKDVRVGVCEEPVKLDASKSVGEELTYRWDVLDPRGVLTSNNTAKTSLSLSSPITGSQPVIITVQLTVTDKYGVSVKDVVEVTFDLPPLAKIVFPAPPSNDETLLVDGTPSIGRDLKYHWSTTTGKIIGPSNKPTVTIRGLGLYSLKVTDSYGCTNETTFQYPFDSHVLMANADYFRSEWVQSVVIKVLNNDYDSKNDFDKRKLKIIQDPEYGRVVVNSNGTITYYPFEEKSRVDKYIYEICDMADLCDTALVTIDLFAGPIWIPEAISVNGDGHNEVFVIRGLDQYPNSELTIYTRSGQLVYKSLNYLNDWGGHTHSATIADGTLLPTGTYYYVLRLGGTNRFIKGFVYLEY
jgi:gliding motility-associated-like protein